MQDMGEQQGAGQGEISMENPGVSEANRTPVVNTLCMMPPKDPRAPLYHIHLERGGCLVLGRKWVGTKWLCSGQARAPSCHH